MYLLGFSFKGKLNISFHFFFFSVKRIYIQPCHLQTHSHQNHPHPMFGIQNFCNLLTSLQWWLDPWIIQTLPEVTLQELIPQKETILQCEEEENHHFPQKIIVFNQLNLILLLSTYYFSIAFVLVFERRIKISFYAKNQSKRVLWLIACFAFACYDFAKKITFTSKNTCCNKLS